jgi:hypothetical protein
MKKLPLMTTGFLIRNLGGLKEVAQYLSIAERKELSGHSPEGKRKKKTREFVSTKPFYYLKDK